MGALNRRIGFWKVTVRVGMEMQAEEMTAGGPQECYHVSHAFHSRFTKQARAGCNAVSFSL